MNSHEIDYELIGDDMQIVEIEESNRRIEDLQSPALPLGYRAILASDEKY